MKKATNFIKNSILLFTLLLSNLVVCQDNQLKKIDELLAKADASDKKFQDLKELEYAKKASVLAEEINDSKRKTRSYYYIARALYNLDLQKQSLLYIEKASKERFAKEDLTAQALLTEAKSYNYNILNLPSQHFNELQKILKLLRKKTDYESLELISRTHINIALYYLNKNTDSVFHHYNLAKKGLEKLPEKKYCLLKSEYFSFLGQAFLQKKATDSAYHYLKKSYQLKQKYRDPVLYLQYVNFGDYYMEKQQQERALDFYLKAIKNMEQYSIKKSDFIIVYQNIASLYDYFGDKTNQKKFDSLATTTEHKARIERGKNIHYALNIILKDTAEEYYSAQRKKYIWISIAVVLFITGCIFLFIFLRKKLKHKENTLTEVTQSIQQKDELISQKSIEKQELEQKVLDAYYEVVELARNNDPSFYFRFQEVYPEFQKKVLEIIPTLKTSELVLCAYIFLGFNTKDIAEYTFKSVNTIRNRKQNLRKKFSIPTEQDMGNWLKNLIDKNNNN